MNFVCAVMRLAKYFQLAIHLIIWPILLADFPVYLFEKRSIWHHKEQVFKSTLIISPLRVNLYFLTQVVGQSHFCLKYSCRIVLLCTSNGSNLLPYRCAIRDDSLHR